MAAAVRERGMGRQAPRLLQRQASAVAATTCPHLRGRACCAPRRALPPRAAAYLSLALFLRLPHPHPLWAAVALVVMPRVALQLPPPPLLQQLYG